MMKAKTRTVTDGISARIVTNLRENPTAFVEAVTGGAWGYEHTIGACEAYWKGVPADPTPQPWSPAEYRDRILREIGFVRRIVALQASPDPLPHAQLEAWILAAMQLGRLTEEAVWRLRFKDQILRDRQHMGTLQRGGPVGLEAIQRNAEVRRAQLREDVRAVDQQRPGMSRRSVAAYLVRHSTDHEAYRNLSVETLSKRIERLAPTPKKRPTRRK